MNDQVTAKERTTFKRSKFNVQATQFRMTTEMQGGIKNAAERLDRSQAWIIRTAISEYLSKIM